MSRLQKPAVVAFLPPDVTEMFIVMGAVPDLRIGHVEERSHIKADASHFEVVWNYPSAPSRYHCTNCFETRHEAVDHANAKINEYLKSFVRLAEANRKSL